MRNTTKLALVATLFAAVSQPSYAFSLKSLFGLDDQQEQQTSSVESLAKDLFASQTSNLSGLTSVLNNSMVQDVQNNLNLSGTQAATGTAALLTLAAEKLGSSESSELSNLIPQLGDFTNLIPSSLSDKLNTLNDVQNLFSGLGLDAATLAQFVPIITAGIEKMGASSDLVNQLSSLWKMA